MRTVKTEKYVKTFNMKISKSLKKFKTKLGIKMVIYEEKRAKHLIHPIDRSWEIWRFCPHRFAANIYIGCSHACVYCYARSLRPDYHKRIEVRINAVELVRRELEKWRGRLQPVNFGSATDPYQPAEEKYKLIRGVLEEFYNFNSPCFIATKSDLVRRDIDIISKLSSKKLCAVLFTIITLDKELKKMIEPFSPSVERRLDVIRELSEVKIPVNVRIDPILPYITDDPSALEELISTIADLGTRHVISSVLKISKTVWKNFRIFLNKYDRTLIRKYEKLYFKKGFSDLAGYRRAETKYRYKVLKRVAELCRKYKLTFGTCKEGFFDLHTDRCSGLKLKGRYYPSLENYWKFLYERKATTSLQDIMHVAESFRTSRDYRRKLRIAWNKGILFKNIPGVEQQKDLEKGIVYTVRGE